MLVSSNGRVVVAKAALAVAIGACAVFVGGCARSSDHDVSSNVTRNRLSHWCQAIKLSVECSFPIERFSTAEQLLKEMTRNRYVGEYIADEIASDGWGEPFVLSITKEGDHRIVRIASRGGNKQDDGGLGDDNVGIIRFNKNEIIVTISRIDASGTRVTATDQYRRD